MDPIESEKFWSESELDSLRNLAEVYEKIKLLFLHAEEVGDKLTFLPASNEFRSAFDHLMRVIAFKAGIKQTDNSNYAHENMERVFGHLYRAGYDSLDYIQIALIKDILNTIGKFSADTVQEVCPEYYRKIKPNLKSYEEEIATLRNHKDIGNVTMEYFNRYIEIVENIMRYDKIVTKIEPSLAEYEQKIQNETRKNQRMNMFYTFIIAVAAAILGILVQRILL